ncbi:MAG: glycosidase [Alphaproteobacteria bacterium]|nr:MAG: glycosidase [Alphaproteobacteria bacterium]
MFVKRSKFNPIITPDMVKPSRKDFKVDGTFNAGVIDYNGETIMLLRVAESMPSAIENEVKVPVLVERNGVWEITVKAFQRDNPEYDFSDPRSIVSREDPNQVYLTSLSHIRLARSTNGVDFTVEDDAFIFPDNRYEIYGCEDPRVTQIEGVFYINYSSISDLGISTSLAQTTDFCQVEKLGVIFAPDNRDICFFPEKIDGYYWLLHRPAPLHLGKPEIWLAKSPDLIHWGDHRISVECSDNDWDQMKIGGGAPLLRTDKGWLQIYHGVDNTQRYCLGALLLDINDPTKVIARMRNPIMEPREKYETEGFFGNVVFCCGAIIRDDELYIYYGAADEVMALATIGLSEIWDHLSV